MMTMGSGKIYERREMDESIRLQDDVDPSCGFVTAKEKEIPGAIIGASSRTHIAIYPSKFWSGTGRTKDDWSISLSW